MDSFCFITRILIFCKNRVCVLRILFLNITLRLAANFTNGDFKDIVRLHRFHINETQNSNFSKRQTLELGVIAWVRQILHFSEMAPARRQNYYFVPLRDFVRRGDNVINN